MILLPTDASNDEVLNIIRDWVERLVADDMEAAYAMLHHYTDEPWTSDFLRIWVSNYGSKTPFADGRTYHITSWKNATVSADGPNDHYQDVERWKQSTINGSVGEVHYDLPLNGEWSDLTAIFPLVIRDGYLALQLDDIHVL